MIPIENRAEFRRVLGKGKKYAGGAAIAFVAASSGYSKFGIIAGRKLGGAVERNRAKRIIREIIRSLYKYVSDGFSIILVAQKGLLRNKLDANKLEIALLLEKSGCIKNLL